jgi:uncharacterized protein (TIGR03437 family)
MRKKLVCLHAAGLLLTLAVVQAAAQGDASVHLPANYTTMQPPANQAAYVDPAFGTSITRVSDALHTTNATNGAKLQWIENEYATAAAFNSDNSYLILVHESYFGLYNGSGGFVGNLPMEINASSEPRWSRMDNNTLYYHAGNQLKTYNLATTATKVVHTFSEYSSISGNGEMDMSYDGDHLTYTGDGRYVFLYTISTDSKSAVFDTAGHELDATYVTPDNHVTITWKQNGVNTRFTGIEMFDGNMNFMRQIAHAGGHMHMSRDLNGDEVLVWFNAGDPQPVCNNAFVKIRLADGVQTCLLSVDWSLAAHVSAADSTWAFVETYNPIDVVPPSGWDAYTNELLQIKLDGSEVRRLVQHRSRPLNSYNYQPKLSASRDGSRFVYTSNFGLQASGAPLQYGDTYMVVVPQGSSSNSGSKTPVTTGPGTGVPASNGTSISGVVNAASYQPALAPGSIVSIFGSGLSPSTMTAATAHLTSFLGSVNVYFNGIAAPLFYASPGQINAQVPYGLAPGNLNIEVDGVAVVRQSATLSVTAPGIFTTDGSGKGSGVILRGDDYRLVSQSAPTQAGAYVLIYCTGLGALNSPIVEGNPGPTPALSTATAPQVTIGNIAAQVTFSGLAPGFTGLYQVNAQVPAGVPTGNAVPVTLTVGGVSSNTATITVQ